MAYRRLPFLCLFCLALLVLLAPSAKAENAVVAAGAGYKNMVNALTAAYQQSTGQSVDLMFGNMAKVTTLAKQSGKVDIVLGDLAFLKKTKTPLAAPQVLGQGRLVLAFAKSSPFSAVADLDNPAAKRIALPDTSKAIYGKAAREFLESSGRLPDIKPRLVEVATIPQVFSYLTTNEVDMGFLNLTYALKVADKLGGYVVIDDAKYANITIIASLLTSCPHAKEAEAFLAFLSTPEAKAIISANGL